MKLLIAGGGTGGHIFPALVVAEQWRQRGADRQVVFVGTQRGLEVELIPRAGLVLEMVRVAGLKGIHGARFWRNLALLPTGLVDAWKVLRRQRPAVVLGTGGYVSGPVVLLAALMGVPCVLLEPNARPGLTNRWLAPLAEFVAVGFPEAATALGTRAHLTGCPVRPAFFDAPPIDPRPPFTLLVTGGSQGSRAINQAMCDALPHLAPAADALRIVHQTGERDYLAVRQSYAAQPLATEVQPFFDDMPRRVAAAHLIVCRAGALTIAEVAAAGRAAIFIPFPAASDAHQWHNAKAMVSAGAGRMIPQPELSGKRLAEEILGLLSHPEQLAQMGQRARQWARPDAAARVVQLLEEAVRS